MNSWRPTSGPEVAHRRAEIQRRLRAHFDDESVLEVDTPALSSAAVSDVQIESLRVESTLAKSPFYLHTSPEFFMKRLLAAGYPDIYSICRVFRDGEAGRHHQPEFTLVEWYRLGFQLHEIIADTATAIAKALADQSLQESVVIIDYQKAFINSLGLDPASATIDELVKAADADSDLQNALGDEHDDWLDLILATRIAPSFGKNNLTVVKHYPASQAALARLCPQDSRFADRFEVFMGEVELANGYVELTDARILAERIADDQENRKRRGRPVRAHDDSLITAMKSGLPACAGVAIGLERLQMVHDKTDDIRDVIAFVFMDKVNG